MPRKTLICNLSTLLLCLSFATAQDQHVIVKKTTGSITGRALGVVPST